ncbi:hypothetical protein SERLA73DRAFT_188815 [Serpula lacrymans var. lacrymans S7.3]|uniref:Uncharacterized protein n=2 Tax=Serpula lacrymans var. lacrymans TaxID=341189 RepID=F8QC79_SERL3|nr:uncharacterized protein SERLADRAFT_479250 [Serpula lacrymans var. lacrymans S7.9]EGN94198.1 hypothetical protein SERLA73DRAFT_188815 [Serpula lacrymans var. lacrymans S7.3]EGO19623.1 hypothetical protein SERLADRAFT_479250 [Serpula lacrymans var. lacrymans S7.9]
MAEQRSVPTIDAGVIAHNRREAQRDGAFAGLTSGLAGALLGSKVMGFGRNKTIVCGIFTGALSGYYFTQAFFSSNVSRLKPRQNSHTDSIE